MYISENQYTSDKVRLYIYIFRNTVYIPEESIGFSYIIVIHQDHIFRVQYYFNYDSFYNDFKYIFNYFKILIGNSKSYQKWFEKEIEPLNTYDF